MSHFDQFEPDYESDLDPDEAPFSSRKIYCRRCGMGPFIWKGTSYGWRLHTYTGKLHICPAPPPGVVHFPSIMNTTTTQAFSVPPTTSKESSIMDKNAVAFIRNDVRTLICTFPSTSAEPHMGKHYTYLTIDPELREGDYAVVGVSGIPKVVYVVEAMDGLQIEPNAPHTYNFTICKVDFTAFNLLTEQNEKIASMLKSSYQESIRRGFRETLLAGLPEDQQKSISILLNKE